MADPTDIPMPPPGYLSTPSMAPLTVDGLPLADATGALAQQTGPSQQLAESQRFWATPPRPLGDPHDDVLLITLAKPTKINYIELDLPHFPHHFYIFYWEPTQKKWLEIQASPNKYSVRFYIDGSVPQVIGPANVLQADQHPSHYGADHWVHYSADLVPFTATKIRLSGNRNFGSVKGGPVDVHGKPANYSLGVRNLDFGTRILSKEDVPLTDRDPDIITERESFTVVTDIAGSPVELSMRENRASDLILGRMWKCEPQPFSYAVIPLYVDARDSAGNPQVIDRFYVEPITSGVRCNLYYSETPPDATDFDAEDTPLAFPLTRQAGQGIPVIDSDGLAFPDKIAYVDVDNQAMQWDPTQPFWFGVDIQPQFDSLEATDHVIWDAGPISLIWRSQTWTLAFDNGYLTLPPYDHQINQRLQFVVGYDGENVVFYSPEGGAILLPASITGLSVSAIRFGAEQGFTDEDLIVTGDFRLVSLVLKKEMNPFISGIGGIEVPDAIASFISDTKSYVLKAPYAGQDTGSTKNSLLRFSLNFVMGTPDNGINPWGFVGGPGDVYDDVVWTPINRDFTLAKGYMQFNPTRAACFKFEFTNLQPQPYEVYQPKTTKVQVFPSAIVASSTPTQPSGDSGAGSSGLIANTDAVHPLTYADSVRLRYAAPTATGQGGISPTEAMYATDPATAQRLQGFGSLYNFQPWQPPAQTPRFNTTASHYYETVDVVQNSRVAYFVALSSLQMFRIDYATDDDTEQYLETFGDLQHIDTSSMTPQRVQQTVNRIVNPSFELDTNADGMPDSYTLLSAGTVTGTVAQSSAQALFGSYGLRVNATAMGSAGTDRLGIRVDPTGLDLANSLAFSVYAKLLSGTPTLRLTVEYYTAANAFISSDTTTLVGAETVWTRMVGNYTPPALADHVHAFVWAEGAGGAFELFLDGLQIEEGSLSDYCDGNQPGCEWLGDANASASERVGIDVSPWAWQPGALSTPADISGPVLATSVVMPSKRKVRGIQFASQQSSAVQLLIDPDFDDVNLRAWRGIGDIAPPEITDDFNASIGSMVKIQRESGIDDWDGMEAAWDTWDDLEASLDGPLRPNWNDLEINSDGSNFGGIAYAANVETTKAGRLYAAARVYTDVPLNEPLVLQLLDESGTVLSEAERTVTGGHVTEWYVGYTIGEGGEDTSQTWNEIENSDASPTLPNYNDLEIQTWDTVDTATLPLGTKVSVQLLQRGSTTDTFYIDTLSLFEDAIVWEFSNDGGVSWWRVYDIRNDPKGVFIFPDPTTPTPSSGTQLMWRVSGYRPYLHVNSLAIRPWYGSLPLGVPHREPGMGGPNLNPTDHFPPVEQDARWQAWHEPVPLDWWFLQRQLLLAGRPYVPVDTSTPSSRANVWINPDAMVPIEPPAPPDDGGGTGGEPGTEIYEDIYGVPYTETYGPEAGGATYTDSYGNGTY